MKEGFEDTEERAGLLPRLFQVQTDERSRTLESSIDTQSKRSTACTGCN